MMSHENGEEEEQDEVTERSDEIVSDIISLIHSSTHSSYVICSQLSRKLISYFSQIPLEPSEWKDLHSAVEVRGLYFCA